MKYLLTALALIIFAAAPSYAAERITVHELNNFVKSKQQAINHSNINVIREHMNRVTAENAAFDHKISTYQTHALQPVWYGNQQYGQYYRYPVVGQYRPVSMNSINKWEQIALIERKKRSIPGYKTQIDVTKTTIDPYGKNAVIDIDMREFSMAYNPYHPTLTSDVLHSNSRCKLYVGKLRDNQLFLSRMDCNTNTNLAF